MIYNGAIPSLHLTTQEPTKLYVACQFGKMKCRIFPVNHFHTRAPFVGDLVHGDICGPMSQFKGSLVYFFAPSG